MLLYLINHHKRGKMEEVFEEFLEEDWGKIKDCDFDLIVTLEEKEEIFTKIGYRLTESGFLIDKDTNEKIIAEDGKEINLRTDKEVALILGSHNFVRNIAGYSQILTERGILKVLPKEE